MTDRTTKLLLAIIALGLWANLAVPLLKSQPAQAQDVSRSIQKMEHSLDNIGQDMRALASGSCLNTRLC
jgi:hypothetical protein